MRVTADTNIVISGLFWRGNPRRVLDAARDGIIELFTSQAILNEIQAVLYRDKFAERLRTSDISVEELVEGYAALSQVVTPVEIRPVVIRDPDDDAVISCALAAECEYIVSGDDDLLSLSHFESIRIVSALDLLKTLQLL